MELKQKKEKIVSCQYCQASPLFWEQREDGRWWLIEDFGFPHTCDKRKEFFVAKLKSQNDEKKAIYSKEKERFAAIPDDSRCNSCMGMGRIDTFGRYRPKCSTCYGFGKITKKVKNLALFHLRKRLWPDLFKKG